MSLRIIAGSLGGRIIKTPLGHKTHPMSEKMRGAIFNALGDIEGLSFLDAYSGSGAIAIEAVSRGATRVYAIDKDKKAIDTIKTNITNLGIDIKATQANISAWIDNSPKLQFDIIVCDPPYNAINSSHLNKIAEIVKNNGILVLSLPPDFTIPEIVSIKILNIKNYGDSALVFAKKIV